MTQGLTGSGNARLGSETSQTALAAGREKYHRAKGKFVPIAAHNVDGGAHFETNTGTSGRIFRANATRSFQSKVKKGEKLLRNVLHSAYENVFR
jgi:hypothetical protein